MRFPCPTPQHRAVPRLYPDSGVAGGVPDSANTHLFCGSIGRSWSAVFEHRGLSSAGHAPRKTPRHNCRLTPVTGKAFDCPLHYFRQTLPIVVQRYAGQNAHASITWSPWRPIISKDAVKDALRAGVITRSTEYFPFVRRRCPRQASSEVPPPLRSQALRPARCRA